MDTNKIIYGKKSLGSILEEIHKNSRKRKKEIDGIVTDYRSKLQTAADNAMAAPFLKEYLDSGIKNDDALVKIATIVQRLLIAESKSNDGDTLLSDEEREQLFSDAEELFEGLRQEAEGDK